MACGVPAARRRRRRARRPEGRCRRTARKPAQSQRSQGERGQATGAAVVWWQWWPSFRQSCRWLSPTPAAAPCCVKRRGRAVEECPRRAQARLAASWRAAAAACAPTRSARGGKGRTQSLCLSQMRSAAILCLHYIIKHSNSQEKRQASASRLLSVLVSSNAAWTWMDGES